jgi:hypothetical protein
MKFLPPPKFYYDQILRIKKDAANFMRGSEVLITNLGNRQWLVGPYWYFVTNLETGRRYTAKEHEMEIE